MKPRGPLMMEHRIIEKMIWAIEKEVEKMAETKIARKDFIDTVIDFIKVYADRTHHGKEEVIMFEYLATKNMLPEEQNMMKELIEEHKYGRKTVGELVAAQERYARGEKNSLTTIRDKLKVLAEFYPKHIEKEDRIFFPASEKYMSQGEQDFMLSEFWEFDRKMIHEKYAAVVKQLEDKIK